MAAVYNKTYFLTHLALSRVYWASSSPINTASKLPSVLSTSGFKSGFFIRHRDPQIVENRWINHLPTNQRRNSIQFWYPMVAIRSMTITILHPDKTLVNSPDFRNSGLVLWFVYSESPMIDRRYRYFTMAVRDTSNVYGVVFRISPLSICKVCILSIPIFITNFFYIALLCQMSRRSGRAPSMTWGAAPTRFHENVEYFHHGAHSPSSLIPGWVLSVSTRMAQLYRQLTSFSKS